MARLSLAYPRYKKPGFNYANVNYVLLGLVIESVTDQPYRASIQQLIDKLGLKNSYYQAAWKDQYLFKDRLAHGYAPKKNLKGIYSVFSNQLIITNYLNSGMDYVDVTQSYDPSWDDKSAGSLVANTIDLTTFAQLALLEQAAANQYLVPANIPKWHPPFKLYYGLGVFVGKLKNGDHVIWHGGDNFQYNSGYFYIPEKHIAFSYLVNTNQASFLEPSKKYGPGLMEALIAIFDK